MKTPVTAGDLACAGDCNSCQFVAAIVVWVLASFQLRADIIQMYHNATAGIINICHEAKMSNELLACFSGVHMRHLFCHLVN